MKGRKNGGGVSEVWWNRRFLFEWHKELCFCTVRPSGVKDQVCISLSLEVELLLHIHTHTHAPILTRTLTLTLTFIHSYPYSPQHIRMAQERSWTDTQGIHHHRTYWRVRVCVPEFLLFVFVRINRANRANRKSHQLPTHSPFNLCINHCAFSFPFPFPFLSIANYTNTHHLAPSTPPTPAYPHVAPILPALPCQHFMKHAPTDIPPICRKNHLNHLLLLATLATPRYIRKVPCRLYRHPLWEPRSPHRRRRLHRLSNPRLPWPARHLHP